MTTSIGCELPGYTDEDRAVDRKVIDGAKTLGELIDEAYKKQGRIVSQPPPESGE